MGLFGLFKLKRKGDNAETPITAETAMPEEPEFLKEIDITAEKEVERELEGSDNSNANREAPDAAQAVKKEAEPELALWLSNGTTVRSLQELAAALKKLKVADYNEHVTEERNDIADWVGDVLNNQELANKLRSAKGKAQAAKQAEMEISRLRTTKKAKATQDVKPAKAPAEEEIKAPEPELQEPKPIIQLPTPAEYAVDTELKTDGKTKPKWLFRLFGRQSKLEKKQEETEELPKIELPELNTAASMETEKPEEETVLAESEPHHEKWTEPSTLESPQETSMAETARDETLPRIAEEYLDAEKAQSTEAAKPKAREGKEIAKEEKRKGAERRTHEEVELDAKEHELMALEEELNKEEEDLNARRLRLTRKRYEMIKHKGEVERKRFEAFVRKHKQAVQEDSLVEKHLELDKGLKGIPNFGLSGAYGKERLQALLEEAKQHISQNNVEQARKALGEAQSAFITAYMPDNEKKQIEYDILEVEADLKLAALK